MIERTTKKDVLHPWVKRFNLGYRNITISSQSDINNGPLSSFGSGDAYLLLYIKGVTGTLNFTNITTLFRVSVEESPSLEVLEFPQLVSLHELFIHDATSSYSVSAAHLNNTAYPSHPFLLDVSGAPEFVFLDIQFPISDHDSYVYYETSNHTSYITTFSDTTKLDDLETNSCLSLESLEDVVHFDLTGQAGCNYYLLSLKSVGDLNITNAANIALSGPYGEAVPSIHVNASMSLSDSAWVPPNDGEGHLFTPNNGLPIDFSRIESGGDYLNIFSNANVKINFNGLTSVGTTLNISNNTNCAFNFNRISEMVDLVTFGNNLFPALNFVSGNVVVEALNPDFDCSKLVSQHNEGTIPHLACNGMNNGTNATTASKPKDGTVLSAGAYAGIGIGSGVVLLDVGPPYIGGVLEFDGTGIIREKPDDPLTELAIGQTELPDDPLIELPIGDVQLLTRPQTLASTRSSGKRFAERPAEDGCRSDQCEQGTMRRRPDDLLDRFPVGYAELPGHPHNFASPLLNYAVRREEERPPQCLI
ncbi:hypothetical protein F4824DRAFT_501158 [Ustulina deusta]|nr:hypothetical protein F4824DRAFT_501158 [Ustulina deusta]